MDRAQQLMSLCRTVLPRPCPAGCSPTALLTIPLLEPTASAPAHPPPWEWCASRLSIVGEILFAQTKNPPIAHQSDSSHNLRGQYPTRWATTQPTLSSSTKSANGGEKLRLDPVLGDLSRINL